VDVLRLYDATRRPASWTEIIRPGQVVAFAKHLESGAPCTADGEPFAVPDAVTCVVFDGFDEARDWCEASVLRAPSVRFDIFDHEGRAQSPLLTVVHPSQRESMEGSATELRRRTMIAMALIAGGVPLMVFAYAISGDRDPILPGFLGLNMVLIALRLLWMNLASRELERTRRARLAERSAAYEPLRTGISPYKREDPR
jgi:hypothetical protein